MHGQFLSISNSVNSSIESGSRFTAASFQASDNYPLFCNISNSLGSLVKAAHYSSIFNGIGNEISSNGTRVKSANSTILNGNRNKILTEVLELDATDVDNNTFSTILNGRNNTIYGQRSTIINGIENTLHGQTNLIFGEGNVVAADDDTISYSTSDFSFLFGEDNLVSGTAYTSQNTRRAGNYVFGKRNQLLLCSDSFVMGGTRIADGGGFLSRDDDSKFILSHDIFCFNNYASSVSGSDDSVINNVGASNLTSVSQSSVSNLYGCNISGIQETSANSLQSTNAKNVSYSNLSSVTSSNLSGISRCSIVGLINSNITGATSSRIQGNNINVDHDLDFSDIFGQDINLTGKVQVKHSRVLGENISFLSDEVDFAQFRHCDVLGFSNVLSGLADGNYGNISIKGNDNSVLKSNDVFVFGDGINVQNSTNSVFFGEDIESSGSSTFVFGDNIDSQHIAGSVIKDSKLTPTQSKGRDTLFLDFDQGTYMNVPLWTGASTPGVGGQIMYSGDNMYIHNGSDWRAVTTSPT